MGEGRSTDGGRLIFFTWDSDSMEPEPIERSRPFLFKLY